MLGRVNAILATINGLPLEEIMDHIREATSRLAALSRSPQTQQALEHLDRTTASLTTSPGKPARNFRRSWTR